MQNVSKVLLKLHKQISLYLDSDIDLAEVGLSETTPGIV